MNFLSNVLNSIPVVGHVKGGIHYLAGDAEGGHRAMYQSTRTSAVMAGGAVGLALGPAGSAVGAVYGSLATDLLASAVSGKSQGLVENCENVGKDIATGQNPMGSIASTGLQIALDGVGGLGMGGVSSAASQISEKAVANSIKTVGEKVVTAVGEKTLQKTFQVSANEVTKAIGKKATEKVVKQVIQQTALAAEVALVSTHVAKTASKQTEEDERKEEEERERKRRERRERERREREERERREREEQERRDREAREREERERREREMREREERERCEREERQCREREERERQVNEERERRGRQERERRANEEREESQRRECEEQSIDHHKSHQKNSQTSQRNGNNKTKTTGQQQVAKTGLASNTIDQQATRQETGSESSQTPQGNGNNNNNNNNNNKKKKRRTDQEILEEFLQLLPKLLRNIFGDAKESISALFSKSKLAKHGTYLIKVLRTLENFDTLEAVLETVIKIFKDYMSEHIKFENFISLLEFVRSYFNEKIDEIQTESNASTAGTYEQRRAQIIRDIRSQESLVLDIVTLFEELKSEIEIECAPPNNICPDFRDIFAKVYHYYKHRRTPELPDYEQENIQVPDDVKEFIPEDGILSVRQYFYWARTLLDRLRNRPDYTAQVENQQSPVTYTYEFYVELFGHRFRVVVKARRDRRGGLPVLVTSTVFIDNNDYDGDAENGYENLKTEKK